MKVLSVWIEIKGQMVFVGEIRGDSSENARFCYDDSYIEAPAAVQISISLPLQAEPFSAERTHHFFEGLLPEGFTRRSVAQWLRADEMDYLSILAGLGKECLGAIQIRESESDETEPGYIRLTSEQVKSLAQEGATESALLVTQAHLSLTGASGKAGLYLDEEQNQWYLPVGTAPSTHIVKQSHVRLAQIVLNEQLSMETASFAGLSVPDSFIFQTGEEEVLFATKRYDRLKSDEGGMIDGHLRPLRLHQEDVAQALGIASADKYEKEGKSYLKQIGRLLRQYSANPLEDLKSLWEITVFNYLLGNTDNHIKNLSLLYRTDLKAVRLAPAYDMLSTAIYESSTKNMAFHIGGVYHLRRIDRSAWEMAAKDLGIGVRQAMADYEKLRECFPSALQQATEKLSTAGFRRAEEIADRIMKCGGIANA